MEAHADPIPEALPERVILFDGVCVVCDAGMQWILDHDTEGRFHFAPLQGPTGQAIQARHPELPDQLDSVLFVRQTPTGEEVSWETNALLQVVRDLPSPWSWLYLGRVVPRPIRDIGYRAFAAMRYRIFGKLEQCRLPKPGEAERFLE